MSTFILSTGSTHKWEKFEKKKISSYCIYFAQISVHVLDLDKSTGDFIYRLFNIYYETKRNINDLIYIFFFQSSTFIMYDVSYSSIMSIRSGMVFGHFFSRFLLSVRLIFIAAIFFFFLQHAWSSRSIFFIWQKCVLAEEKQLSAPPILN
jgi:hypothetical protein